jgi:cysteine desulfurase/selenocysteine lyase
LSSLAPAPLVPATSGSDEAARWHDFPGLVNADGTRWHYLDTAATAQKPQAVIDAVTRAIGADYATVHRGVYSRSAQMTLGYEAARRRVADFIGGREEEIVFVRGATEAINLVAYAYPEKGRVLLSALEHHSNIVPWQLAGWQVDVCPLTEDGRIDLDAAAAMLTREHTMVALAHVSNVLGSVLDAARAAELAHSVGAKLLLDGCQAVPRMPVDVAALDGVIYGVTGHNLLGPKWNGALRGLADLV